MKSHQTGPDLSIPRSTVNLVRFFIDTNVLSRLTRAQRASKFFRDHCSLCSEVLHEASGFPDLAELRRLEYPMSAGVLARVRVVMLTVPPGDFRLVDLYRNLGNADPILIASALEATEAESGRLFAVDWHIVSDDAAVISKAKEFDVTTLGYDDFLRLLSSNANDLS